MPDISLWWYLLIYVVGVFLAPFVFWVLWFISMFSYGYFGGNTLDQDDLNYFEAALDGADDSFVTLNVVVGFLGWPIGVPLGTLIALFVIISSVVSGLFSSVNISFESLTAAINRSAERRRQKNKVNN